MSILLDHPGTHSVPDDRRLTLAEMRASMRRRSASDHEIEPVAANTDGSDKLTRPTPGNGSDKPSLHWETASRVVAANALNARGRGKRHRPALEFPELRRVYARTRTNAKTGEIITKGTSYYGDIWDHLQAWGFRLLNDLHRQGLAHPAHADLADLFREHIMTHGQTWHPYDGRGPGLGHDAVDHLSDTAATASLRDWDADWNGEHRERSAKGGRNGSRGPTWTPDQLADLQALHGLTVEQQAARLGLNPSKVKRMRAEIRRAQQQP